MGTGRCSALFMCKQNIHFHVHTMRPGPSVCLCETTLFIVCRTCVSIVVMAVGVTDQSIRLKWSQFFATSSSLLRYFENVLKCALPSEQATSIWVLIIARSTRISQEGHKMFLGQVYFHNLEMNNSGSTNSNNEHGAGGGLFAAILRIIEADHGLASTQVLVSFPSKWDMLPPPPLLMCNPCEVSRCPCSNTVSECLTTRSCFPLPHN